MGRMIFWLINNLKNLRWLKICALRLFPKLVYKIRLYAANQGDVSSLYRHLDSSLREKIFAELTAALQQKSGK